MKPNFWLTLISEFVIGGMAMFIFWKFFLEPLKNGEFKKDEPKKKPEDPKL